MLLWEADIHQKNSKKTGGCQDQGLGRWSSNRAIENRQLSLAAVANETDRRT